MLNRKKDVPQPSDFPEVMNQVQVARLLGLSCRTVQTYTQDGTIPHRRLGRRFLYSKTRLLEWLAGEKTGKAPPKVGS